MTSTPSPAVSCSVWWAHPAASAPGLLDLLDASERARHDRFRLQADRDRYRVARALARLVCAERAGCAPEEVSFTLHCRTCADRERPHREEPHGKPRPAGPAGGLEISISHSGDRVVLAVADSVEVGVDVERVAPARDLAGLADYALAPAEFEVWRSLDEAERVPAFFRYWARKEALLKSTGAGLAGGLDSVAVSAPGEAAAVLAWEGPYAPGQVWLADLEAGPDYRAALAALAPGPVEMDVHGPQEAAALLEARPRALRPPVPGGG